MTNRAGSGSGSVSQRYGAGGSGRLLIGRDRQADSHTELG